MHPVLFTVGSLRIPTYGTLLVLAILSAIYLVIRLGRREGLDSGLLLDFSTWVILVALVGAKALMIVADWRYYWENPGQIFSRETFLAGGVFYGGFVAAAFFAVWYVRVHGLPYWKLADIYAPAVALGQSVGRLGCFAGGCDYGKPTTSFLGVTFTDPYSHEISGVPLGIPLYPTQVLESLATLSIMGILLWRHRGKSFDGQIFILYLALYGAARFGLEFLRGDEDRGFMFNHLLSTSQFIALLALVAAGVLTVILRRRSGGGTSHRGSSGLERRSGSSTGSGETAVSRHGAGFEAGTNPGAVRRREREFGGS